MEPNKIATFIVNEIKPRFDKVRKSNKDLELTNLFPIKDIVFFLQLKERGICSHQRIKTALDSMVEEHYQKVMV